MSATDSSPVAVPVSTEEIASLSRIGEKVTLPSNTPLSSLGSLADNFYVLLGGELSIHRRGDGTQKRVSVRPVSPGEREALLLSPPAVVEALAVEPCQLLRFSADVYLQWVSGFSPANSVIVSSLVQRTRTSEALLLEGEKLAALGKMSAALAHEMNNPASAARRAASELSELLADLRPVGLSLVRGQLTSAQAARLTELQEEALKFATTHTAEGSPRADPLETSDREERLGLWLRKHGVADGWRAPTALAKAGLDTEWLESVALVVPPEMLGSIVAWMAVEVAASGLVEVIAHSTGRVSELVAAVKSYSFMDRAPIQEVDVHEGLESTLVMLGHKLQGISIVRSYGQDLPRISASSGELNQVWTNLIDNAIDALKGKGCIELRTYREDPWLVVEVVDDGPGIPAEVQSRIFEAFFTTKATGTGMGLGLDICRRIVVGKHQGDIRVDSEPGRTRFRVYLPLQVPQNPGGGNVGSASIPAPPQSAPSGPSDATR